MGVGWLALDSFQDVAGEIDAQVRVGVSAADREAQPGVGDAAHVGVETARIKLVVVPTGASWAKPAVWPSSIRSVIFRSGCSSKALWTMKSGR
jgi:hypothetical protein